MLYLHLQNIHKSFNEKPLLAGVDCTILKGQKVALVAKNGAGKSTLLKIIKGSIEPSLGTVTIHPAISVRFLDQTFDAPGDLSVRDAIFSYQHPTGQLIVKYEQLVNDSLADPALVQSLLEQIEFTHAREYEAKVKSIISQLQLSGLINKPLSILSGGEAKRVAIANVLVDEPDFLILDEPTNHLDVDMIESLEKILKKSDMTLLMVTHDRYFLERVCTDIYELERGAIVYYPGNYQYYLTKKAEREELQSRTLHHLKQDYKQELARVRKAPRGRGTKSVARESKFYELQDHYQDIKQEHFEQSQTLSLDIQHRRLGSKVIKMHGLCKSYGDKIVLNRFTYDIKQGERLGIIGPNGVGKSTVMNIIAGVESYDSGSIEYGPKVKIGYYQQQELITKTDTTVLDAVKQVAEVVTIGKNIKITASQLLERFLFTPTLQQSRVSSLSGGEKRRLHLLMVLIENPNVLILDEPTNDLDLVTLNVLEQFLLSYTGCLIIISHDRFFMDKLVEHLFVFTGGGAIQDFWGTYSEYKLSLSSKDPEIKKKSDTKSLPNNTTHIPIPQTNNNNKKLSYNEQREFETLGKEIQQLEQRKEEINLMFQQTEIDHHTLKELGKELNLLITSLDIKESRRFELLERE